MIFITYVIVTEIDIRGIFKDGFLGNVFFTLVNRYVHVLRILRVLVT